MLRLPFIEQMRLERRARHLHSLGPRATAEFLAQLSDTIGGMPAIMGLLNEYQAKLTPELLRAVGADRFPNRRPRIVPTSLRGAAQ